MLATERLEHAAHLAAVHSNVDRGHDVELSSRPLRYRSISRRRGVVAERYLLMRPVRVEALVPWYNDRSATCPIRSSTRLRCRARTAACPALNHYVLTII